VCFLAPATLRFVLINRGGEERLGDRIARLRQPEITEPMRGVTREALRPLLAPVPSGGTPEVAFETVMRGRDGREYPR
jgi:hypothetical protein